MSEITSLADVELEETDTRSNVDVFLEISRAYNLQRSVPGYENLSYEDFKKSYVVGSDFTPSANPFLGSDDMLEYQREVMEGDDENWKRMYLNMQRELQSQRESFQYPRHARNPFMLKDAIDSSSYLAEDLRQHGEL